MTFPILPVFGSNYSKVLKTKPFLSLTNHAIIDTSSVTSVVDIVEFVKLYFNEFAEFSILLDSSTRFTEDQLIELLNNGIKTIFCKAGTLKVEAIPKERIQDVPQTIKDAESIDQESFAGTILDTLRTDRPDGLYSTIVVDQNERCLGLAYSSRESLKLAIEKRVGVYYSRSRNEIWEKGLTSGNTQKLLAISIDCDGDALKFTVCQNGLGFCHMGTESCFGSFPFGLSEMERVLLDRQKVAIEGSYTKRLFEDSALLDAKIREEAEELTTAQTESEVAWEAADLFYFAMVKLVSKGVFLADVRRDLARKHLRVTRRKGDAKPKFLRHSLDETRGDGQITKKHKTGSDVNSGKIYLNVVDSSDSEGITKAVTRPIQRTQQIMHLVTPIIDDVRKNGDAALLGLTKRFDGVELKTPVLEAPFPPEYLEGLTDEVKEALDLSIENVRKFHAAQLQREPMVVTTQPGVTCSRFPRPIEKVGLYIPGGTAILPSTALMLGVPAQVAGCKEIIFASPPRKSDGRVSPEVVYVAQKVGASKIVLAGGAQAVAAMAYGTESVPKVDKILGPGNQFVTAAKMYVQNDTQALCSIDMPAGPSEVLVIADMDADVDFVASDLLSQAEHGVDSQVILVGISLSDSKVAEIQEAVNSQALKLPRCEIVRKCISHSTIIRCHSVEEAFAMSNKYAPEHLILQLKDAENYLPLVNNAGSVFVGAYTPESCGDYSSGTNHTLPTYGYARQYSGTNTASFQKFITSQVVTPEGLQSIGKAVMALAKVEGLDAHRNAIKIRMGRLGQLPKDFV